MGSGGRGAGESEKILGRFDLTDLVCVVLCVLFIRVFCVYYGITVMLCLIAHGRSFSLSFFSLSF